MGRGRQPERLECRIEILYWRALHDWFAEALEQEVR